MSAISKDYNLVEENYQLLRQRLNQLDYTEHFDYESIPLIQKLLADLIQTTQSCRSLKTLNENLIYKKDNIQYQIEPLNKELGECIEENNNLHEQLIKELDSKNEIERKLQELKRKYENEIKDLKFVLSQYRFKLNEEQKKNETEKNRVEDILKKSGVLLTTGDVRNVTKIPASDDRLYSRLQTIDIETGLDKMKEPHDIYPKPDPIIFDTLEQTKEIIKNLENSNENYKMKNKIFENEIDTLKNMLNRRDIEIKRLSQNLKYSKMNNLSEFSKKNDDANDEEDKKSLEERLISSSQRIKELEIQVEYWQEHVQILQKEVDDLEQEKETYLFKQDNEKQVLENDLKNEKLKNAELGKNINKFESMVKELTETRVMSPPPKKAPTENMRDIPTIIVENKPIKSLNNSKFNSKLEKKKKKDNKSSNIDSKNNTHELKQNITILKDQNSKLLQELDELKRQINDRDADLEDAKVALNDLEESNENLTVEKNEFKKKYNLLEKEVESLKKEINEQLNTSQKAINDRNIQEINLLENSNVILKQQVKELEEKIEKQNREKEIFKTEINKINKSYEELNKYKDLFQTLKQQNITQTQELINLVKKESSKEIDMFPNNKEYEKIKSERDKLLESIKIFDKEFNEMKEYGNSLIRERDNLKKKNNELLQEFEKFKNDTLHKNQYYTPDNNFIGNINQQTNNDNINNVNTKILNVDNSNEYFIHTISDQKLKMDKMNETLNKVVEEKKKIEEDCDIFKTKIKKLEDELCMKNNDIKDKQLLNDEMVEKINNIENEIKLYEKKMKEKESNIEKLNQQLNDIIEKNKKSNEEVDLASNKANDALNQLENLQEEYTKNKKEYVDLERKIEQQNTIIQELDNERDEFQIEVDKKTEKIVELEELIQALKDNELKSKQEFINLRDQIDLLTSHLTEQDKEVISQSRQLSQLKTENDELINTCQRYEEEIRNNNADVASLTKENQILNNELADYANSRNEMNEEVKILTEKVNYLDQLVLTKDQEKEQIMLSYKKLINEHEKLDVTYKYSTEENNNARVELILQKKQMDHLNQMVKEYSKEIAQLKMDAQAYDNQITNLNRSLQTSDREIRQLEVDKEKLIKEVVSSRDLNLMIDRTKDEIQKEYTRISTENEQMDQIIKRLETDKEALINQLRSEKLKSERFENLLAVERTKQYQLEKSSKELEESKDNLYEKLKSRIIEQEHSIEALTNESKRINTDNDLLRTKISELESNLNINRTNIGNYEKKISDYKEKIEELELTLENKKQIINEILLSKSDNSSDELSQKSKTDDDSFLNKVIYDNDFEKSVKNNRTIIKKLSNNREKTEQSDQSKNTITENDQLNYQEKNEVENYQHNNQHNRINDNDVPIIDVKLFNASSSKEISVDNNRYLPETSSDLQINTINIKQSYQNNVNIPTSPTSIFSLTANKFKRNKIKGKSPFIDDNSFLSSFSTSTSSSTMSIESLEYISSLNQQQLSKSKDSLIKNSRNKIRNSDTNLSGKINKNVKLFNEIKSNGLSSDIRFSHGTKNTNNNDTFEDLSFNISRDQPVIINNNNNKSELTGDVKPSINTDYSLSFLPFSLSSPRKNIIQTTSAPNTISSESSESIGYYSDINNSKLKNSRRSRRNNKYHDQDQLVAVLESITQVTKNFQEENSQT